MRKSVVPAVAEGREARNREGYQRSAATSGGEAMTVVETAVEDLFVGLENAESRRAPIASGRLTRAAVGGLILAVEFAWLGTFAYGVYLFVF